jgi:catechol 2,3-dioxygenase-like lactoylglutathione lyase family enzyme
MLTFGSVVIGVDDLPRASEFWQQALGYRPREEPDETWAVLVPGEGAAGPQLALMVSVTEPREQPRIHVDLYADDPAAEVDRLTGLGATEQQTGTPAGDQVVVLEDTEGNRFCVIAR